jgi:hypothetical protein
VQETAFITFIVPNRPVSTLRYDRRDGA